MALITLLTDFGITDTYVGQMKGTILATGANATLVDLTHAVPPQDVRSGAFLLWSAVGAFPPGSIHLAVVDPGVGSKRRAIAVRARRGDILVGPDNGLLPPAVERLGGKGLAIELTEPKFWRDSPCATFHGRDIFGPVAGHLAKGTPLESLGRPLDQYEKPIQFPPAVREGSLVKGEILHIDTYGNLVTSIPAEMLPERYRVQLAGETIPPARHYQEVDSGDLLAVVGSFGLLEISVRDGDASATFDAHRGDAVTVLG